ncbi:glycosyltransferase family 25 protein [Pseudochryseolinea flava]|nr:glycosyltransferase family 25 protein [Pseudochryseolinea flava]
MALVVSLPFREDRRAGLLNCKEMQQFDWKFLDAIHGKSIEVNSIPTEIVSAQSQRSLSNGSIGAILSHYAAWNELLSTQEDSFYVFEDDIILTSDFKKNLENIWADIPANFDIIYLGSGMSIKNDMLAKVSNNIYVPHFPRRGLYGYILSRTGIGKLIRLVFPINILFGGIDTVIGNLVRRDALNAYHVHPDLCTTDMTFTSNIYNPSVPDKHLHQNEF